MTPYGKGQGGSSSPGSAASPSSGTATGGADNYLVQRGYIEVVEDVRGTGDSNGSWGLFDPIQQRDAIKVLNWAAHLPTLQRAGRNLRAVLPGDRPAAAGRRGGHALAAEGDLPDGPAPTTSTATRRSWAACSTSSSPRPTSGSPAALNTANPLTDTRQRPHPAVRPRRHRGRPRQRAGHLSRRADREHPHRRRRGLRRLLLAGPQPAERARARRRQPHPRLHDRRRVRHLPERRAAQLRRAAERLGRPQRRPRRCRPGSGRPGATS